ncbi:hypothetical protein IRB23M11_00950 [Alkalibacterium sp. m-11]|uniref:Flagellar hook-length control protein-like C-terminal domain-containing protein n=1 Tax=Alkalibacterium indicireducens TaxID=398758 RepID=A0ABP3KT78_9LACT
MNTIEIAALTHLKTLSVKNNESSDVDQTLFSKKMEKFSTQKGTQDSKDLKGESSQTPLESEEIEDLTEEEEVDFTLIHPFVRLHQGLEELPVELGITALHNQTIEESDTQEVLNTPKVISTISQSDLTGSQINEDPSVLNKEVDILIEEGTGENIQYVETENISLNGTQRLEESAKDAFNDASKPAHSDNKQVDDNNELTSIDSISSKTSSVEYEQTAARKNPSDFDSNLEGAREQKNDSLERMTVQSENSTEDMEGQEKDLIFEPTINSSVKESDTQNSSIDMKSLEQNLSQIASTDKQIVKDSPKVEAQPSTPVTQEQSLEVISEMLMTVSTEKSGEKIYNSTLTLTPETLGEVKIELIYTKDGISGQLVFSSEESKEWMEKQWNQLKLPLETKGIFMNQFEFSVVEPSAVFNQNADTFAQSGQQFNQQSQQQSSSASQTSYDSRLVKESNEEKDNGTDSETERTGLNLYA